MATPFQMPRMVFDPDTGRMVPVGQVYAPQPDQPIPMTGAQPMAPVTDEALIPDPLQQLTEPAPNFWQRGLDNIAASGGLQTSLVAHPKFADSFFQNLLVSALNGAARNRQQQTQQFAQVNEAIRNQNLKDREATIARRLKAEEERKAEQRKGRERKELWAREDQKTAQSQAFEAEQNRLDREARARDAANRASRITGLTGGTMEEVRSMLNPEAIDQAARLWAVERKFPTFVRGPYTFPMQTLIMNRAAELYPGLNPSENAANYSANKKALEQNQQMLSNVEAFSNTARRNAEIVRKSFAKIPDFNAQIANKPYREVQRLAANNPDLAAGLAAMESVINEYAKIINNPRLVGQMPLQAVEEMRRVVNGNMPLGSMVAALETLEQESANRHIELMNTRDVLQSRINNLSATPEAKADKLNSDVADAVAQLRSFGITTAEQLDAAMREDPRRERDLMDKLGSYGARLVRARLRQAGGR